MSAWQIHVFGVRHLSPTGAWHLRRYLDALRPKVVLIEGLADADELIPHLTREGDEAAVAILAYTDSLPVRTLVYPLARYSPEYQAMLWAEEHNARVEFIDLPSDIFLGLQDVEVERMERTQRKRRRKPRRARRGAGAEPKAMCRRRLSRPSASSRSTNRSRPAAGEPDYDTYWERRFEHNLAEDSYRLAAYELGQGVARRAKTRRSGVRRTWSAKPSCAAGSRRCSATASSRNRSSPSSAPFTLRS